MSLPSLWVISHQAGDHFPHPKSLISADPIPIDQTWIAWVTFCDIFGFPPAGSEHSFPYPERIFRSRSLQQREFRGGPGETPRSTAGMSLTLGEVEGNLVCNVTHRPCGLPGLQHWGCLVVEDDKRDCRKYSVYVMFSGLGFRVVKV